LLACGLALGACATQTPLPTLPSETPAAWRGGSANDHAQPAPDLANWWRAFNDPVLDGLIDSALQENLGVAIAGLRLQAARRVEHRSRSEFWPNLNFRIYEETAPGATTGYFEMGFDSAWEFGFFGRARASMRIAMADLNLAIIDEAAARVSVCAEVAKDYVDLRAAQARLQVAEELVELRAHRFELLQVRVRTRLAAQAEADHAQAELEQAGSEASEALAGTRQAGAVLAVLLGRTEPDSAWSVPGAQPVLPELGVAQAPADLVRTRPEIRRAEQNVLRAAGDLGIARADLWPKLGLVGSMISASALTGDIHANKAVPLIGPTVQLPLWDWGARRDVAAARESALAASLLAYRQAVLEGLAEVESALAGFSDKSFRDKNAATEIALGERAANAAGTLKRVGLGDGLDEAQAQLGVAEARLQQINARRERALAFIALYKAFGGVMPPLEAP